MTGLGLQKWSASKFCISGSLRRREHKKLSGTARLVTLSVAARVTMLVTIFEVQLAAIFFALVAAKHIEKIVTKVVAILAAKTCMLRP